MATIVLEPAKGRRWKNQARELIHKLEDQGPFLPLRPPGCYSASQLDLVRRAFHYTGKGRDTVVGVTANRQAFIALLQAMKDVYTIQVSGPLGSFRSCSLQQELWEKYQAGTGHLVTPPGKSYHQTGRAFDLYLPSADERQKMLAVDFHDLLPQDPPHFTFKARG